MLVLADISGIVLDHVPVLHDLAVLEPEDVDDGVAARAGLRTAWTSRMTKSPSAKARLIALWERGNFSLQEVEETLQARLAVGGAGIVLGVACPDYCSPPSKSFWFMAAS